MSNILFNKRVRRKGKLWFNSILFTQYYESERYDLKEKLYTFFYNFERTGTTTRGEADWSLRMLKLFPAKFNEIESEFKKDYLEFETANRV